MGNHRLSSIITSEQNIHFSLYPWLLTGELACREIALTFYSCIAADFCPYLEMIKQAYGALALVKKTQGRGPKLIGAMSSHVNSLQISPGVCSEIIRRLFVWSGCWGPLSDVWLSSCWNSRLKLNSRLPGNALMAVENYQPWLGTCVQVPFSIWCTGLVR